MVKEILKHATLGPIQGRARFKGKSFASGAVTTDRLSCANEYVGRWFSIKNILSELWTVCGCIEDCNHKGDNYDRVDDFVSLHHCRLL